MEYNKLHKNDIHTKDEIVYDVL